MPHDVATDVAPIQLAYPAHAPPVLVVYRVAIAGYVVVVVDDDENEDDDDVAVAAAHWPSPECAHVSAPARPPSAAASPS